MSKLTGCTSHEGDGLGKSEHRLSLLDLRDLPDERSKDNKTDDCDVSKAECDPINLDVRKSTSVVKSRKALVNLVSLLKTKRIQDDFQLSAYPGVIACDSSTPNNLNKNPDVVGGKSPAHVFVLAPDLPSSASSFVISIEQSNGNADVALDENHPNHNAVNLNVCENDSAVVPDNVSMKTTDHHSITSSTGIRQHASCRPNVDITFPLSTSSPIGSVGAISTLDRSANKSDAASSLMQVPKNSRQTRVPDGIRLSSNPISRYPIPHPPIHRPATAEGKEFTPIPWQRCVVESISPPVVLGITKRARQRALKTQMSRVMECRVVNSAQAAIANERAPGVDCPSRKLRCELKGEWAGVGLETGKLDCLTCSPIQCHDEAHSFRSSRNAAGDFVNIISPQVSDERLTTSTAANDDVLQIDFSYMSPENSLIAHPDILYPMTTMARAVACARRPLVMDLVKRNGVYARCHFTSPKTLR